MRKLVLFQVFFVSVFLAVPLLSTAKGNLGAQHLISDEIDFSEVGEFTAEICTENQISGFSIKKFCLGRAEVQERSVRAFVFFGASGAQVLYIELNPPPVEMLKPVFEIVGPIHPSSDESLSPEIGEATVLIDKQGEVEEIRASTPRLGFAKAAF